MPADPGTTGVTLSFSDIEKLWIANGGAPEWAPTMAGIAIAESGGMTNNLNSNASTGDFSIGLWQINYFGGLGPARARRYGQPDALANDPNAQAKAAVDILGGGPGITAWAGDTVGQLAQNGKPLTLGQVQHVLPAAATQGAAAITRADGTVADVLNAGTATTTNAVSDYLDPLGVGSAVGGVNTVGGLIQDITSASFWKRVGMGALGVALFGVGLLVFFEGTDTGQRITSDLEKGAALAAVA